MLAPWKKSYDKPRQHIKIQKYHFASKGPYSPSSGFSTSHVQMWELDPKEGLVLNNWCFWTVVLEKTLESRTAGRSNQSILKEIIPEYSLEGLMLKLQYFGHLMWRADSFIGEDPDAREIWGQWEKALTEDEMVGWHHRLRGHEFEHTPGDSEGQGSLMCCSPWGRKKSDTTEWLNYSNKDTSDAKSARAQ